MEISLFIAKLLGLYFLIIALIMLVRKQQFQSVAKSIVYSEGLLGFSGIINLILGLAIVIGNPIFELSWRGLITLLGLIAILHGVIRIGFVHDLQKAFPPQKLEQSHWIIFAVILVLGAVLTYFGFSHPTA